ncbi:MAG: 23S rRNA (guanine745-N1)-methyltransferase [Flavobacteriales bacterium]|jgi:23S rRNA (guanine745-N1)-methyltransferase
MPTTSHLYLKSMPTMPIYKCPLCSDALEFTRPSYRCGNGHCFDQAKEGYVNLLPVQHKKSRQPGDDDDMMRARQRFLSKGYYQGLASSIGDAAQALEFSSPTTSIVDIGCGEGYYLDEISKKFAPESINLNGLDIAKLGVKMAAKRSFDGQLSVASAYALPYFDNSIDLATSVFSPICPVELQRVLKPGGYLIMVGPGPMHLRGLVERIYDEPQDHEGNFEGLGSHDTLSLIRSWSSKEESLIQQADILDLLTMTPYYWHIRQDKKHALLDSGDLKTALDFELRCYQYRPAAL